MSSGCSGNGTSWAPFCSSTIEPFVMLSMTTLVNWILPEVFFCCVCVFCFVLIFFFIGPLITLLLNNPPRTIDNNWEIVKIDAVPTFFRWDMVYPCIKVGLIPGLSSTEWNLWTLTNKLLKTEMSLPVLFWNPLFKQTTYRVGTMVCYPGRDHELHQFTAT